MSVSSTHDNYDLKHAVTANRLAGLWRLMTGFRRLYFGATLSLAVSRRGQDEHFPAAALLRGSGARAGTPGRDVPAADRARLHRAGAGGGWLHLPQRPAGVADRRGRGAAGCAATCSTTSSGSTSPITITPRPANLIQRSTSDVDAIRRFFADQAIGIGRIVLLFVINLAALLQLNVRLALLSIIVIPPIVAISVFFFKRVGKAYEKFQEQEATLSTVLQENLTGVRVVRAFARQEFERREVREGELGEVPARPPAADDARASSGPLRYPVRGADALRLRDRRADGDQRRDHGGHLPGLRGPGHPDHLAHAQPGPSDRPDLHRAGVLQACGGCHQPGAGAADRGQGAAGRDVHAARSSSGM